MNLQYKLNDILLYLLPREKFDEIFRVIDENPEVLYEPYRRPGSATLTDQTTLLHILCDQKYGTSLANQEIEWSEAFVEFFLTLLERYPLTKDYLQNSKMDHSPLHIALRNRCTPMPFSMIQALIEKYPELLSKESSGTKFTPLHHALMEDKDNHVVLKHSSWPPLDLLDLIWAKDPGSFAKVDCFGRTPLHLASAFKHRACIVESLIKRYPQAVGIKDTKGFTPVQYAICNHAPCLSLVAMLNHWRCISSFFAMKPIRRLTLFNAQSHRAVFALIQACRAPNVVMPDCVTELIDKVLPAKAMGQLSPTTISDKDAYAIISDENVQDLLEEESYQRLIHAMYQLELANWMDYLKDEPTNTERGVDILQYLANQVDDADNKDSYNINGIYILLRRNPMFCSFQAGE